eukprot:scaffold168958_cov34-Prasinocladus_malaysianus.AAC.1
MPSSPDEAMLITCMVPGCKAEFPQTTGRAIRICPEHKTSDFTANGEILRYCNQCSRPHELSRFLGDSHSCEERLERKRQRRLLTRRLLRNAGSPDNLSDSSRGECEHRQIYFQN